MRFTRNLITALLGILLFKSITFIPTVESFIKSYPIPIFIVVLIIFIFQDKIFDAVGLKLKG